MIKKDFEVTKRTIAKDTCKFFVIFHPLACCFLVISHFLSFLFLEQFQK